jgi:hypothetical protein
MAGLDSGFPAATLYECASIRGLDLDQVLSPESMSEMERLSFGEGRQLGPGISASGRIKTTVRAQAVRPSTADRTKVGALVRQIETKLVAYDITVARAHLEALREPPARLEESAVKPRPTRTKPVARRDFRYRWVEHVPCGCSRRFPVPAWHRHVA